MLYYEYVRQDVVSVMVDAINSIDGISFVSEDGINDIDKIISSIVEISNYTGNSIETMPVYTVMESTDILDAVLEELHSNYNPVLDKDTIDADQLHDLIMEVDLSINDDNDDQVSIIDAIDSIMDCVSTDYRYVKIYGYMVPIYDDRGDITDFDVHDIVAKTTANGVNLCGVGLKESASDDAPMSERLTLRGNTVVGQITANDTGQLSGRTIVNPIYGRNIIDLVESVMGDQTTVSNYVKHAVFEEVIPRESNRTSAEERAEQKLAEEYGFDSVEAMKSALSDTE